MVRIITDTTAGMPQELAQKYDIPVIPQVIIFGEESYAEGVDIDIPGFMQRLKNSSTLPHTAAPEPEWFMKEFERLVPLGEPILCLHPSTEVSGTVRSALTAKMEFPGADIRVVDTRLIACPLATVVEQAAIWARQGLSADEIEARVLEMSPRARFYLLVPTLEYLARGGRIGGAQAFLGSMLQIKPILTFKDGRIDQFEKQRTYRKAYQRLINLAVEQCPPGDEGYLSIFHASVPAEAEHLAADLKAMIPVEQIPILDVPPAIVTHAGPGLLGISFFVSG